jgi:nicotinamidase-related amidase
MHRTIRLDPKRAALLLIDFQEEQRADPLYKAAGFDAALANAARLLEAARQMSVPVYHAAYQRDFAVMPPRPFEPASPEGRPLFSDAANPLTALCSELAPLAGETVIVKNDASAFGERQLGSLLAEARTEWLIIAGVWTEACVAASVRDALAAGLRVLLIKDACASGTQAMHEVAVLNIANRLYGGAITDTDTALSLMSGKAGDVWITERPVPILFDYVTAGERYRAL